MGARASSPLEEAEVALLRAKAAAETTRAAADAARAAADAAATTTRAAAETARASADAAATTTRANADAARATADAAAAASRAVAVAVPLVLSLAAVAALAADFYVHESPSRIRRRMLRTLRVCRLPPSVPAARPALLPVAQAPLTLGLLPRMLLGPTGCGKTTALEGLARGALAAPVPAPTVLVRLRLPSFERAQISEAGADAEAGVAGAGAVSTSSKELMDSAALQFYEQIGFPLRRSLLGSVLSRGFIFRGQLTQAELSTATTLATRARLVSALEMLFSACAQVRDERFAAGLSALDAAPVLLFDEVQDLIKDSRLKRAGGDLIFQTLGTLIVAYAVDRKAVRVAVAGSSAELDFAFGASSAARGNRWDYFTLADPSAEAVTGALEQRGYTSGEARDMIALCGTRLRLLQGPLEKGAAAVRAKDYLVDLAARGRAAISNLFAPLDLASAARLAGVLDGIAAADAGAAGVARPRKSALPAGLREADISSALYVDLGRELFFQSQLHARSWAAHRGEYVAAPLAPTAAAPPAPPGPPTLPGPPPAPAPAPLGPPAPAATQQAAAQPSADQPTTAQPTAAQPTAAQPTSAQPTAAQPTAAQPLSAPPPPSVAPPTAQLPIKR